MKTHGLQSVRYPKANRAYATAELARIANFMRRHNLMSQFHGEDEQVSCLNGASEFEVHLPNKIVAGPFTA